MKQKDFDSCNEQAESAAEKQNNIKYKLIPSGCCKKVTQHMEISVSTSFWFKVSGVITSNSDVTVYWHTLKYTSTSLQ